MSTNKQTEATSLGEILQAASRQHVSGLLRMERIILRTQMTPGETGEVYLLAGRPIFARTDQLTGLEALKSLLMWYRFRYALALDAPRPVANLPAHFSIPAALFPSPPPSLEHVVPRRIGGERQAFSLPLTRQQRLVYFLINGERTIADLARCSSRTVGEVESVVRELQEQGLLILELPNPSQRL